MLFVPTLLAFVGFVLCLAVILLVLRAGIAALSGNVWAERWGNTSFITFTWHELGRSLFLGLVGAIGTTPMAVAFFAGAQHEIQNILTLTGLAWAAFAAGIFLIGVSTGLIGFLRFEHQSYSRRSIVTLVQLIVVGLGTLPVFLVFFDYLMPTLSMVVTLWLHTMGMYARLPA
jgi:hypothetical protein